MPRDFRIVQDGQRLNYTCQNSRFRTNVNMGCPHGGHPTRGSALQYPLYSVGGLSLWLEHVSAVGDPDNEWYWLMWYDNGRPTIPMSGVVHRQDILHIAQQLAGFEP